MAKERVDRTRKVVRRNSPFAFHLLFFFFFLNLAVASDSPLFLKSPQNSRDHLSIYALHGEPLFFQHNDGPYLPTLRLLHKCE